MSFTWNGLPPEKSALLKAHGGERVVAVRPALVRALRGNGNAAILLSQFLYWSEITDEPNGWFYNTGDKLTRQTGLGRDAQKSARIALIQLGLIEEILCGLPAKLHIRVCLENVAQLLIDEEEKEGLKQVSGLIPKQDSDHTPKQDSGHAPKQASGLIPKHSKEEKITEEIKEKTTSTAAAAIRREVLEVIGETVNFRMGAVSPKFTTMLNSFVKAAIAKGRTVEDVKRWRDGLPAYLKKDADDVPTPTLTMLVSTFDRVLEQKPKAATMSEADLDALAKKFA